MVQSMALFTSQPTNSQQQQPVRLGTPCMLGEVSASICVLFECCLGSPVLLCRDPLPRLRWKGLRMAWGRRLPWHRICIPRVYPLPLAGGLPAQLLIAP
ncbi:unnamed protein product [Pieris brassicae]|uniref:Uncharacterized protein n=1 Tax=Pieris brassicae TaxID=7116 RepID=A0A9P0TSU5_PIEBR|nr:unnamed protein product [Pieris brassicae]